MREIIYQLKDLLIALCDSAYQVYKCYVEKAEEGKMHNS
jgi:elongation factor P--beta-lysine ligase